jgi:hypothetical protein
VQPYLVTKVMRPIPAKSEFIFACLIMIVILYIMLLIVSINMVIFDPSAYSIFILDCEPSFLILWEKGTQ